MTNHKYLSILAQIRALLENTGSDSKYLHVSCLSGSTVTLNKQKLFIQITNDGT